jgi:lysine N6-hydroxylase
MRCERFLMRHYLCAGIGVGPANLSLASLLYSAPGATNIFFEKKESFGWHDGQLIDGATLQVSMLKDLVSLADPTNKFSFLAYLHGQRKIYHFLNAQFNAVPREEFRNYMEWASRENENIFFGEEVLEVDFEKVFIVRTSRRTVTADNVVLGVGTEPWVPVMARDGLGRTQFHVSDFMDKARDLGGKKVCVVGGGQSAAEAFLDLLSRPAAERPRNVSWVSRRANYLPLDDSPFTNDFYMPCHSDYFFQLNRANREDFNERHLLTSDGIAEAVLRQIYQRVYVLRFIEAVPGAFCFLPNRAITELDGSDDAGWTMTCVHGHSPDTPERIAADVVIWATGFRPASMDFLKPISFRLQIEDREYRIDEDFAVRWDGPPDRAVFVQNGARQQRGHADANLSLNAWRSQRIADRLLGTKSVDQLASFISWAQETQ